MKKDKTTQSNMKPRAPEIPIMPTPKDEALWRPLYPFESKYMMIKGFAYHYIDEQPDDSLNEDQTDCSDDTQNLFSPDEEINENNVAENQETNSSSFPKENVDLKEKQSFGSKNDRPTLLFVHGNPTWSFYWRNILIAFRKKYRVIAVDHIGCGLSEKPSAKEYPYSLERRVSDLAYLVKKLNLNNVILVAHDWGVAVGMGAAIRHSKRFSKIVLMNGGAYLSHLCPLRIRICRIPILNRIILQSFNTFALAALRSATAHPSLLTNDIRAGYLAPYDSYKNRVAVYQFVQDIPMTEKHRSYQTLKSIEDNLTLFRDKPVSLIWGMQDFCFTSEFLKRFLHFYPEADVHRIEKAGHYVVEDATDEVISILDHFINR